MPSFTVAFNKGVSRSPLATSLLCGLMSAPLTFVQDDSLTAETPYVLSGDASARGSDVDIAVAVSGVLSAPIDAKWLEFAKAPTSEGLETVAGSLTKEIGFLSGEKTANATDAVVCGRVYAEGVFDIKRDGKKFPLLSRWMQQMKHQGSLKNIFSKYDAEAKESKAGGKSLMGAAGKFDLVDAKDDTLVITRFPPEPSGFLHIGHIKAALMNDFFAHDKYHGKLRIRFDDTNPCKERDEFYASILSDLETVGVHGDFPITYSSDYFDKIQEFAEKLVREGKAYVDFSTREEIQEGRRTMTDSKCRNQSIEENLRLWNEMLKGSEEGQKCILRGKTDMKHKNAVMRDPGLYRCIVDTPHRRTGDKYKAYPLYDFAIPIIDSLEGVTHALRSSEYHDRAELYDWVANIVGLRCPKIEDFSRLNFGYVLLSKRKLQWFVDHGVVASWEDPRFPTVRGLMRRGLTVKAMREFVKSQGSSKALNLMSMDKLWAVNKRLIDPEVPRFTAVDAENKWTVDVTDAPAEPWTKEVLRYKKDASMGKKTVTFSRQIYIEGEDAVDLKPSEEITLMEWGNVIIDTVSEADKKITCHLNPKGNARDTSKKLTWLSTAVDLVPVDVVEYDHLITVDKIPEGANWEDYIRPVSKVTYRLLAEPVVATLELHQKIQFERRGYFALDALKGEPSDASTEDKLMTFIMIPTGSSHPMLGQKIVMKF